MLTLMLEITAPTGKIGRDSSNLGGDRCTDTIVAKGTCPFCNMGVGFRQISELEEGEVFEYTLPVRCDSCYSVFSISYSNGEALVHPTPSVDGVEDVPEAIDQYYQEALDCLSAQAPNGAVTLFRKTIHAIAIHYEIAEVDESMGIYEMINELHDDGQINEKLRKSLLAVKDLGNDGAHINENEPDMEQARAIKELIDAVLSATVIADQRMEYARDQHPNEFADDDDNN